MFDMTLNDLVVGTNSISSYTTCYALSTVG